jgi:formate dehydrogenase beta subunit
VFDADPKAGGFMRTQVPRFRLPESVIDEECGYILDLGVELHRWHAHRLAEGAARRSGYDAVFVGSGAPRGRDLDLPGRQVKPQPTSTSASTGWHRSRSSTSRKSAAA